MLFQKVFLQNEKRCRRRRRGGGEKNNSKEEMNSDLAIRSAFEQPTETFKRLLKKTKMFKNRHSLGCSVTKWIDYFFTIWPCEHLAQSHKKWPK